jgi:PAS domain S-box-containing protein
MHSIGTIFQELFIRLLLLAWWQTVQGQRILLIGGVLVAGVIVYWHIRAIRFRSRDLGALAEKQTAELQEQKREMATLLSNLPGMVYRCRNDQDWTMKFASEACLALTGYPPAALLGNSDVSYGSLIHPDDKQAVWKKVQSALHAHHPFQLTYRITTRDNQMKWVWEQGQGIWNSEGELLALEGLITDITEQKRLEAALSHQQELSESLREISVVLNSSLELETILPQIFQQMQRVFQYDSAGLFLLENDALVLCEYFKGNHPEPGHIGRKIPLDSQYPIVRVYTRKQALVLADAQAETEWGHWPGSEPIRGWVAAPLFDNRGVLGVLTADSRQYGAYNEQDGQLLQIFANQATIALRNARLFQDVRDAKEQAIEAQKLTEEALKEAEVANQAKSAFLANMSHELRTPLHAILGFAQIMSKTAHSSEEGEYLHIIQRSGTHLLTLINQVLELSKIESDQLTLNERPTDLFHLLDNIEEIFSLRADSRGIRFFAERSSNIPRYACLDDVKLRYILMSILQNAIKFTDKEGTVSFCIVVPELKKSDVSSTQQPINSETHTTLQFSICDTGRGISSEKQLALFQAFAQTAGEQWSEEGLGISLTISQKFIRLMDGDIHVHSDVPKGTTVTFDIRVQCLDPDTIEPQELSQDSALQMEESFLLQDLQDAPETAFSAEALKRMPHEMLDDLQEAADMLDQQTLRVLITRIREQDTALADALTRLAETYQFDVMSESIRHIKASQAKS